MKIRSLVVICSIFTIAHAGNNDFSYACLNKQEKIVASPFLKNRGKWISQKAIFKASSRRPRDMKLLNGQDGKAKYTFYTGTQTNPWIIIDLKSEFEIKGISIAYRQDSRWLKRTKGLTVELSNDKKTWKKIWTAPKGTLSWEFLLKKAQNGRYVRISIPGNKRQLCLKNVKIYGIGFSQKSGPLISLDATFTASSRKPKNMKMLNGQDSKARLTFYTGTQANPWIIIDLKSEFEIKGISIAYRQDNRWIKRTKGLTVELSDDKKTWRKIWIAPKEALSWKFLLLPPCKARYVKISLPGDKRQLCFKNVKIYGTR